MMAEPLLKETTTTTKEDATITSVIVVGAGIAGLSLTLGLVQQGLTVHLIERRHNLRKRGGGTYLVHPNGMKALDEICSANDESSTISMQPLYEMGIPIPMSGGKMFAWWMVRDALLQHVEKMAHTPAVTMWLGWTFEAIEQNDENITATFVRSNKDDQTSATTTERMQLTASMLVGCDGVHSAVRASLGLPVAVETGSIFWRGTLTIPEKGDDKTEAVETLEPLLHKSSVAPLGVLYKPVGPTSKLGLFNYHSKYPRVMTWAISSTDAEAIATASRPQDVVDASFIKQQQQDDQQQDYNFEQVAESILALADPEDLQHAYKGIMIPMAEPAAADASSGWGGQGRVTLIGDAAHAMRAAGGLGGSMALEDCVVLLRLLKSKQHALEQQQAVENLIQEFENSRLPRVYRIWKDQKERKGLVGDQAEKDFFEWVYKGV